MVSSGSIGNNFFKAESKCKEVKTEGGEKRKEGRDRNEAEVDAGVSHGPVVIGEG